MTARLLLGALGDGRRTRPCPLGHPVAPVGPRPRCPASCCARSASAVGVRSLAGRVLQVARAVLTRSPRSPPRSTASATSSWRDDDELLQRRGGSSSARARLERVEAVGGEQRALDERRRRRSSGDVVRAAPSQDARRRARARGRGPRPPRDAGALGVELVARSEADDQPALAVGVRAGRACLKLVRASPESTSACSGALEVVGDALVRRRRRRRSCRPRWRPGRLGGGGDVHGGRGVATGPTSPSL